jgi:hypothetical protein
MAAPPKPDPENTLEKDTSQAIISDKDGPLENAFSLKA